MSKPRLPRRRAGIMVPLFALRGAGDLGVGDTATLKTFIDWCAVQKLSIIQLLPVNETSGDNSPYNAISSCALDITTLAVSPEALPGLDARMLEEEAPAAIRAKLDEGPVAYRRVKALKWKLCRRAFAAFTQASGEWKDFESFCREEAGWLDSYVRFRALMDIHGGSPVWEKWPEEQRTPHAAAKWVEALSGKEKAEFLADEQFYRYVQWVLYSQWEAVASAAASKGIGLMGDIPFGVSRHSADVWAEPELFDLKRCGGAPPEPMFQHDLFTKVWGQNWGIPLYDWGKMRAENYAWWRRRVGLTVRLFKLFRIDHVLGFYRIYSFPWQPEENASYAALTKEEALEKAGDLPRFLPNDDETEESKKLNCVHGESLLKVVLQAAGDAEVIAEDLGMVPVYVRPSLTELGIAGFKIPIFERNEWDQEYKTLEDYQELSLVTLSTHDHDTMAGRWDSWWAPIEADLGAGVIPEGDKGLGEEAKQASWELYRTLRFAGLDDHKLVREYEPAVREAMLAKVMGCPSAYAILMITDFFGLKTRFNVPGPVSESNWSERLPFTAEDLRDGKWNGAMSKEIAGLVQSTGRC